LELDNERRKAEIEILKAQEDNLKAQREKEDIRMGLMRKVVEKIDINELPDYLRTFVINSIFNPSQQITTEMQLMDDLHEQFIKRADAQTRKDEAGAIKEESQADIERTTADKTIFDFKTLKNQGGKS
jgi:hypothetical protein